MRIETLNQTHSKIHTQATCVHYVVYWGKVTISRQEKSNNKISNSFKWIIRCVYIKILLLFNSLIHCFFCEFTCSQTVWSTHNEKIMNVNWYCSKYVQKRIASKIFANVITIMIDTYIFFSSFCFSVIKLIYLLSHKCTLKTCVRSERKKRKIALFNLKFKWEFYWINFIQFIWLFDVYFEYGSRLNAKRLHFVLCILQI